MIVFLLLVIIAIMLLGASRFRGVVTAVIGVLVAAVAVVVGLGWAASAFNMDSGDLLMYVLLAGLPLLLAWAMASSASKSTRRSIADEPTAPQEFVSSDPLSHERRKAIRRKLRGLE